MFLLSQYVTDSWGERDAAKNLILSGVRSVTLQDVDEVEISDLSAQFYLTESDVGKNRAEACIDKLQELNNAVRVTSCPQPVNDSIVQKYQVLLAVH